MSFVALAKNHEFCRAFLKFGISQPNAKYFNFVESDVVLMNNASLFNVVVDTGKLVIP